MSYKDFSVSQASTALMLLNIYSSLILKTHLLTVIFDPVKLNLDKYDFDIENVDAIIITHEHYDHFDKKLVLEIQRKSGATIITTPFVAQRLKEIEKKVRGLMVGESVQMKDCTFYAEYCQHSANQPLSFVIRTETVTIYHPDDSDPFAEMTEIRNKYEPGILLYLGTSAKGLAKITEMVRPSIVISYFDPRFADLKMPDAKLKMLKQFETFRYP